MSNYTSSTTVHTEHMRQYQRIDAHGNMHGAYIYDGEIAAILARQSSSYSDYGDAEGRVVQGKTRDRTDIVLKSGYVITVVGTLPAYWRDCNAGNSVDNGVDTGCIGSVFRLADILHRTAHK